MLDVRQERGLGLIPALPRVGGGRRQRVVAVAVDDRQVGTGRPGPITKRVQETYFATVRGQVDQYKDWLDHVD